MKSVDSLRLKILELSYKAHSGHIGCSLSCIDLLHQIFKRKTPADNIILSKGHAATALYACLHHFGELTEDDLATFYQEGTRLSAHPSPFLTDSAPYATGSLGHGLPVACGIALAKKLNHESGNVFVLMSDGETNEGTTWEAAHFARQHKLLNLIIVIDKNGLQGFGESSDVLGDTCSNELWSSMGFSVIEINGHNEAEIETTLENACNNTTEKPVIIIANTVKGKGVSYMENKLEWHYWPMNEEQYHLAVNELNICS